MHFRYMHVESHLQYRPYKCSFCGYDNRKEIFIILHIKKVHGGRAEVIRDINTELEHEWVFLVMLNLNKFEIDAKTDTV